ncbi:DUF4199 domain-containing protein [Frigoriflavimonas asaccharolytica]|uniref:4-amino-4-deoxy-L-arabinose transferase-like glycosyltransferase n=1 Tax=Frigoriflavimonas asaccharolytica TaxID=2735899 RepID=A0A8J8GAU9_9FLAO|nr:DUF4199 domain-containing protein [Frigoriflavimonas asaccharolytica]NRS92819.1 4-amino-4-deoxy-L-arabinose transferase-like glycosyltransferase [Frigoriflavimonas asaccharolytica]
MKTFTKSVYTIGFVIFIAIMIAFFTTNIFFRNVDYYKNSIMLSAFLLPILFAAGAFISVTTYSRYKKVLSFKEAYGRAFMPMFVGGFLSVISMFLYINYIDTSTKDLLNYQYIESYKNSLEEEYQEAKQVLRPDSAEMPELEKKYQEGKMRIAHKVSLNEDMFTIRYFAYVFAGFCIFFLFLALFFGSFFRTRISELENLEPKDS